MKTFRLILISACVIVLTNSCYFGDDDFFGCVKGDGDVRSEEFHLPTITGVKLRGIGEVIVRRGDTQEVIVETDDNLIEYLDTDINGGVWDIDFDRCVRNVTRLTVYITVPEIEKLIISGSGSIVGEDAFTGDDLETSVSGSGNIEFDFTGNTVDASVSGSGNIDLFGSADFMDVNISGSGDVRAFDLFTQECDVHISGSGDVRVNVEDFLKVRISGSGDVLYLGHPTLDVDITGSGSVIDRN
jgi:hypothetical protein